LPWFGCQAPAGPLVQGEGILAPRYR
jgi:hypothetical protein